MSNSGSNYKTPIKSEPHNILEPTDYKCKECGEERFNNLEVAIVINSLPCTVYQIFCNTCSKHSLVEVLDYKTQLDLDKLNEMSSKDVVIHQIENVRKIRSALTGRVINPDRKLRSAGEKSTGERDE